MATIDIFSLEKLRSCVRRAQVEVLSLYLVPTYVVTCGVNTSRVLAEVNYSNYCIVGCSQLNSIINTTP